jgi:hypothetical protein
MKNGLSDQWREDKNGNQPSTRKTLLPSFQALPLGGARPLTSLSEQTALFWRWAGWPQGSSRPDRPPCPVYPSLLTALNKDSRFSSQCKEGGINWVHRTDYQAAGLGLKINCVLV